MKRTAYVDFYSPFMLRVNTPFVPQKTFNLHELYDNDLCIDLVTLNVVKDGESKFFLNVLWGSGSQEDPFTVCAYTADDYDAVSIVKEISKGENVRFQALVK